MGRTIADRQLAVLAACDAAKAAETLNRTATDLYTAARLARRLSRADYLSPDGRIDVLRQVRAHIADAVARLPE